MAVDGETKDIISMCAFVEWIEQRGYDLSIAGKALPGKILFSLSDLERTSESFSAGGERGGWRVNHGQRGHNPIKMRLTISFPNR